MRFCWSGVRVSFWIEVGIVPPDAGRADAEAGTHPSSPSATALVDLAAA